MTFELRIPDGWQFGQIDVAEARRGGIRRSVALAIQRTLFDTQPEAPTPADTGAETPPALPFAEALAVFTEMLTAFQARQDGAAALLDALVGDRQQKPAAVPTGDRPPADEPAQPDAATGAFCLTLQGVCWSLAAGPLGNVVDGAPAAAPDATAAEDGEAAESDDEDAAAPDDKRPDDALAVDASLAVTAIAGLLRRTFPTIKAGPDRTVRPGHGDLRLVAKGLLQCLLEALPNMFVLEDPQLETDGERPLTRQRIVAVTPDLRPRVERLLRDLPHQFTVQPLAGPVGYLDGPGNRDEDREDEGSCFRIPLLGYRRTNGFLGQFLARALRARTSSFDFSGYLRAVDRQQAVPWRINAALLNHARRLTELARNQPDWSEDVRAAVADAGLDQDSIDTWREWIGDKFYRYQAGERKAYSRAGEFLDSLLAQAALIDLTRPDCHGELPPFYLPWKADYRGRIYAETPWLSPQGGDLQRALFEFARGQPLDERGIAALRRHGANLVKRERLRDDLEIRDRHVLTLQERERWVQDHEDDICRSAESPLGHPFWRDVAGKPMQFLAFCLTYRQWKVEPDRPVYLPVQIDGTCNGLQHIAALTGDARLAQAVNVLPRDDGLPADIYSEVARAAQETVGSIAPLLDNRQSRLLAQWQTLLVELDAILAGVPAWRSWLDRSIAKAVIMTVPYGASAGAQARRVLAELEPRLSEVDMDDAVASRMLGWADVLHADRGAGKILWKCVRGRFKPLWRQDCPEARDRLRTLQVLGTGLAWVMVTHLRAALTREHPVVDHFASWLGEVASRCGGLPLMWLSPMGLPVCQDKFKIKDSTLNARIGKKKISIGITSLEESVDESKQGQALLPNLIHGLDATHLAMTINSAVELNIMNIGSIHDCLLCHPNDADHLGAVVRQTFVRLYRRGSTGPLVLERWVQWMRFIADLKAASSPNLVLGALDNPGGIGEQWLKGEAGKTGDGAGKGAAQHALAVLEAIRSFDPPRRVLARMLLEYARDRPVKSDRRKTGGGRRHSGRKGGAGKKDSEHWPDLPAAGTLDLGGTVSSNYFFS